MCGHSTKSSFKYQGNKTPRLPGQAGGPIQTQQDLPLLRHSCRPWTPGGLPLHSFPSPSVGKAETGAGTTLLSQTLTLMELLCPPGDDSSWPVKYLDWITRLLPFHPLPFPDKQTETQTCLVGCPGPHWGLLVNQNLHPQPHMPGSVHPTRLEFPMLSLHGSLHVKLPTHTTYTHKTISICMYTTHIYTCTHAYSHYVEPRPCFLHAF